MSNLIHSRGSSPIPALRERIARLWFALEDHWFERRNRLDLGGVIPPPRQSQGGGDALVHATSYQAVWCRNLRELLIESARTDVPLSTFVDLGAGKGKACFFAARQAQFETVIGIELVPTLVDVARHNARRFGAGDRLRFEQADASTFTLPEKPCLVFMFNPFDKVVLDRFLEHNQDHFRRHDSLVAYANDVHLRVLARHGFDVLSRNQARRISLHRLHRS